LVAGEGLSLTVIAQAFFAWVVVVFWCLLALLVAFVAKSLWVTITAVICYYLIESLVLDVWLPAGVPRFLPVDNQNALLYLLGSEAQGLVVTPHPSAATPESACVYFPIAMIVMCFLVWLRFRRDSC